jgi:hypothetical protein
MTSSSESRVETGSNNFTVAMRIVGDDEKGTQCLGYNRATLFLGGINTRNLLSRLREISNLKQHIWS